MKNLSPLFCLFFLVACSRAKPLVTKSTPQIDLPESRYTTPTPDPTPTPTPSPTFTPPPDYFPPGLGTSACARGVSQRSLSGNGWDPMPLYLPDPTLDSIVHSVGTGDFSLSVVAENLDDSYLPNGGDGDHRILIGNWLYPAGEPGVMMLKNKRGNFSAYVGSGAEIESTYRIPVGGAHRYGVTRSAYGVALWVDGYVVAASTAPTGSISGETIMVLGLRFIRQPAIANSFQFWKGTIGGVYFQARSINLAQPDDMGCPY